MTDQTLRFILPRTYTPQCLAATLISMKPSMLMKDEPRRTLADRWDEDGPEDRLSRVLRELRTKRGWSQDELAERMTRLGFRMHQTQVAKIENGSRALRFNEIVALSVALGVAVSTLLDMAATTVGSAGWGRSMEGVTDEMLTAALARRHQAQLELDALDRHEVFLDSRITDAERVLEGLLAEKASLEDKRRVLHDELLAHDDEVSRQKDLAFKRTKPVRRAGGY